MKIIIDTHIFLWLIFETKKVKANYMTYLQDRENTLYLSSMSIAEMMIKKSIDHLELEFDMFKMIEEMGVEILDFDGKSALQLGTLPFHHRDPFDRMIISQAITNGYRLMSEDQKFKMYDCNLIT